MAGRGPRSYVAWKRPQARQCNVLHVFALHTDNTYKGPYLRSYNKRDAMSKYYNTTQDSRMSSRRRTPQFGPPVVPAMQGATTPRLDRLLREASVSTLKSGYTVKDGECMYNEPPDSFYTEWEKDRLTSTSEGQCV